MSTAPISHPSSSILAVVVVYNCAFSQSQSVSSLFQILTEHPELAKHFSVVLYDNSPQPQSAPTSSDFRIHYLHDPSNGGLATAYNFALARAEAEKREWLLLLDQDTSLTHDFVSELLEIADILQTRPEVAAIVPKLSVHGNVHSPAIPFTDQMRRQFQRPTEALTPDVVGVQPQRLCAYNSGSTLRVAALRAIGGFPVEFWLDFLDHAVFHALIHNGYQVYVMLAMLTHDSSYSDLDRLPLWRLHNILLAQTLYLKKSGNILDRLLFRIYLLRHSRILRQNCKDPRMWKEAVRQALLFRVPTDSRPHLPSPVSHP
jgi:GT2 family glycosyltransferase